MEGVLEGLCSAISLWHGHSRERNEQSAQEPLQDVGLAQGLLQLWDGICCLLSAQAKPRHWQQQLLKALKLFTPETRTTAADRVLVMLPSLSQKMAYQCKLISTVSFNSLSLRAVSLLQDTATSIAMHKTGGLWGALKPATLQMIFGMGDVEDPGRQTKRPKR